jgi:hypothetical protein
MPPKKKMPTGLAQPRKTSEKVKPVNMTQEAWEAELARCWCVTEDRNRRRRANKVTSLARQATSSAAAYVVHSDASGSTLARSGVDAYDAPARCGSPHQTSRFCHEMGESVRGAPFHGRRCLFTGDYAMRCCRPRPQ